MKNSEILERQNELIDMINDLKKRKEKEKKNI